jgi:hypothetical protein
VLRPGPAEDCGGVYAYELISAATSLDDPGSASGGRDPPRIGDRQAPWQKL